MSKILYKNSSGKAAKYAMVLIHGRGANAEDILSIASEFIAAEFLFAAPQAPQNTWYPYSFLAPVENNQPYLNGSLAIIENLMNELISRKFTPEKIILTGFSQGACLALEFAYRNPQKFGGIAALSGALISIDYLNRSDVFSGIPLFLGCSERDPHIPLERVNLTEDIFIKAGADVKKTIYPGSFHGITEDEINELNLLMNRLKSK